MDKNILNDYIDACEVIKEIDAEIKRLEKRKKVVQDKVKGSNSDWPYEERSFSLSGTVETQEDVDRLKREKHIREIQKASAANLKLQVEEWMKTIPFRMQRIIRYKFFNRMSWEETAKFMGNRATGESVKKEFQRFTKEK